MTTLALPGDADLILEWGIARAVRRDGQLNRQERQAALLAGVCADMRRRYSHWQCSWSEPCFFCEELDDL